MNGKVKPFHRCIDFSTPRFESAYIEYEKCDRYERLKAIIGEMPGFINLPPHRLVINRRL